MLRYLLAAAGLVVLYSLLRLGTAPSAAVAGVGHAGSVRLVPDQVPAITWTSLHLVYEVGSGGMAEGGGLQVQYPKSWHPWVPGPSAPQTSDPTAAYYVTAKTSRTGSNLAIGIANAAIDGRAGWLDWTTTLTVTGDALLAGDLITYTLGDQTYGGAGARASATAMEEVVHVAIDPEGDGVFVELSNPPVFTTAAWEPLRLAVYGPTRIRAGVPFRVLVAARDTFDNVAGGYSGTIRFTATDAHAELPPDYTFAPEDRGRKTFTMTLHTAGTHWITASDDLLAPEGQDSNPMYVTADTTAPSIYWGDLHSHTQFSMDGAGPLAHALDHARHDLGLDFYAATDHVDYSTTGLMPEEWQATRDLLEAYHDPGEFVSILAYEWSMPAPYGHHNVYFQGDEGPLCYLDECRTLDELWDFLEGEMVLTIPHHTGIEWWGGPNTVDWSYNRPEFRTSIEIYSVHGQSELYDPGHPLSYESLHPGWASSADGPYYARDAWAAGHKVGVVAGSDNHDARPGMPWNGLTAIHAGELTRASLLEAIRARHTYATTGERILVDFALGEAMMGDLVRLTLSQTPTLYVHIAGTAPVDWVELVRYNGADYTVVYSATSGLNDDPRQVTFSYTDPAPPQAGLYYVRMQQQDPNKPDRPAMAWSSPIWLERDTLVYLPFVQAWDE